MYLRVAFILFYPPVYSLLTFMPSTYEQAYSFQLCTLPYCHIDYLVFVTISGLTFIYLFVDLCTFSLIMLLYLLVICLIFKPLLSAPALNHCYLFWYPKLCTYVNYVDSISHCRFEDLM